MKLIYLLITLPLLSLFSCRKFDNELAAKNAESGLVLVQRKGGGGPNAKIDEEIEVFAKVGVTDAELQFYVGNAAATPVSRESRTVKWPNYGAGVGDSVLLPMEVFTMLVPRGATLGPANVYFTLGGVKCAPLTLNITKPDILYPGKVTVEPFVITPRDDFQSLDGPVGTAVVGNLADITYDEKSRTFYILEYYTDKNTYERYYVVRKLQNNELTTLAGGGADFDATEGKSRNLGEVLCMRAGPDGQLYLATISTWMKYSPVYGYELRVERPEIIKIDPQTGRLQQVAGGKMPNGSEFDFKGIRDGKEAALLSQPRSMAFDTTGNLYFIDGMGALVRKLTPDGTVTTLYGGLDSVTYESQHPATGEPIMVTGYYPVQEHTDGFGKETRFNNAQKLAMAGNGKLYVYESSDLEFRENIREINPDTKEVATIIGQPAGSRTYAYSGTFKEVELRGVLSFDVDYDGNILLTNEVEENWANVYKVFKMDLQKETVMFVAGGNERGEESFTKPQPGAKATFGYPERIVFDQFGNLYVIDGSDFNVHIRKITIER